MESFRRRLTQHLVSCELVFHLLLDQDDVWHVGAQPDVPRCLGDATHRHDHLLFSSVTEVSMVNLPCQQLHTLSTYSDRRCLAQRRMREQVLHVSMLKPGRARMLQSLCQKVLPGVACRCAAHTVYTSADGISSALSHLQSLQAIVLPEARPERLQIPDLRWSSTHCYRKVSRKFTDNQHREPFSR